MLLNVWGSKQLTHRQGCYIIFVMHLQSRIILDGAITFLHKTMAWHKNVMINHNQPSAILKWCKSFPPHVNSVSTLPCKTWNAHCACYHWGDTERNSSIYPTATVASKFATFESSWLQSVRNIAREDVKNTHHWSRWTETATENGVEQAGSRRDCGSHPSAASSIAPDQWCMFCTPSCNIFHALLSTGFKSCNFGDHSWGRINSVVSLSNNAIVARARDEHFKFHKVV